MPVRPAGAPAAPGGFLAGRADAPPHWGVTAPSASPHTHPAPETDLADPAVRLSGVCKTFGSTTAVAELDLTVPRDTIYGLLGPNGAGKTTAIRMMLDILGPDSGSVSILGRPVDDEVRSRIGYLPEERGLYQKMRVVEHLVFLGALKGMDRAEARREARRWLERLDLGEWAEKRVESLSKGMQQKVQFIGTILHSPELLILDEPFSGLDPINVALLRRIVLECHRAGSTILFSTHLIEDAERLCERVCMIAGARKVLDGTVSEVKASSRRREIVLAFEGDAAFLERVEVDRFVDHGRYAEARLAAGEDGGRILRAAIDAGVEVLRYEVVEPTLREIFLERAGEKGLAAEAREQADGGLAGEPAGAPSPTPPAGHERRGTA